MELCWNDGLTAAAAAGPGMHASSSQIVGDVCDARSIDITVAIVIKQYVLRTTNAVDTDTFPGSITKPCRRLSWTDSVAVSIVRLLTDGKCGCPVSSSSSLASSP